MTAHLRLRRPARRRPRPSRTTAAIATLASSLSVAHAANSTVDWQFTPGTAATADVPACRDQHALVLSAPQSSTAGTVTASIHFKGSYIALYGIHYPQGAPALIVVDGDYRNATHADESMAAAAGEGANACIKLAEFGSLSNNPRGHTLEVILQGDAVAPDGERWTFTIANVTTADTLSNLPSSPDAPSSGSGSASPTQANSSKSTSSGPNIAAIVGPIVAVVILIAGGIMLWLLRRRKIRNAKKAPSAAFRAEHPSMPMGNIHNTNAGAQSEDDTSPRQITMHSTTGPSHSASSSGATLVADLDDEKKKLAEILAVRDAERTQLHAQLMSPPGERVPWGWSSGAGDGGWEAPGRGSGRGRPVAGWDPEEREHDGRF